MRHPAFWVPTAWLAMGLAYAIVTNVSALLLHDLGLGTADAIGWASLLGVAYVVKPLYAPVVELRRSKRFFLLLAQAALCACLLMTAAMLQWAPWALGLILLLFAATAFFGSVQDIACEGLYLTKLDPQRQGMFSGVQSVFWNGAALIGGGALIAISGLAPAPDHARGWALALALCGAVYAILAVWHRRTAPVGRAYVQNETRLRDALTSFVRRPNFWPDIALCLAFPITAGLVDRIEPFFLIGAPRDGGLGLSREVLAGLYAGVGFGGLIVGATLGSLTLLRRGLEKSMLWMGLAASAPAAIYLMLALAPPTGGVTIACSVFAARALHAYGMVGYVVYLQRALSPGPYPTTHYNLASGLKALTMMSAGAASGYLQSQLGYAGNFATALACGLGVLVLCRPSQVRRAVVILVDNPRPSRRINKGDLD